MNSKITVFERLLLILHIITAASAVLMLGGILFLGDNVAKNVLLKNVGFLLLTLLFFVSIFKIVVRNMKQQLSTTFDVLEVVMWSVLFGFFGGLSMVYYTNPKGYPTDQVMIWQMLEGQNVEIIKAEQVGNMDAVKTLCAKRMNTDGLSGAAYVNVPEICTVSESKE